MTAILPALLLATALAVLPATASAQTVIFAQTPLGALPNDFDAGLAGTGGPGRWEVVTDDTAEGGRALTQLTAESVDYRFLVAIYNRVNAANVEVTTRFKPIAGRIDQAGGVIVRAADAQNYYVARANALEDNVRFYRVNKGRRQELATADGVKVASGQWHTLTLRAQNDQFSVVFNGKPMHTTTDTTNFPRPGAGRVGIWTKADSVTRFDRLEIKVLP